jgi:hypothetical protein
LPYHKYLFQPEETANFISEDGEESSFLVEIDGDVEVSSEINISVWATAKQIATMPILASMKREVIDRLVRDGLL